MVTPFQAAAWPLKLDSPLATALQMAGYGKRDDHRLCERELATVLAALRYWQGDPVENDPSYGHHFQECPPLSSDEFDALCERLNR